MTDWEQVLRDIDEIRKYFENCARNCRADSGAGLKFFRYSVTLGALAHMVREKLAEEDDGK